MRRPDRAPWRAALAALALAPAAAWGQAAAPAPAPSAVDWSIDAQLRFETELNTNQPLDRSSDGTIVGVRPGVEVIIGATTRRSVTRLSGSILGSAFTGSDDADDLDRLDPSLAGSYLFTGPDYRVTANGSFRQRSTSIDQIEDTGVTTNDATQTTVTFGFGYEYDVNQRHEINLGADGQITEFSGDDGAFTPSRSLSLRAGWLHRATRASAGGLTAIYRIFDADQPRGVDSQSISLQAGINYQRTPRHVFGASLGFTAVFSDEPGGGTDTDVAATGGATLGYSGADWRIGAQLSHGFEPSSEGELRQFTRLGGELEYDINARQSLRLSGAYSRRSDADFFNDARQFFSIGPTWLYRMDRDTALSLGYAFRAAKDEGEDFETGHVVLMRLTRDFSLLP